MRTNLLPHNKEAYEKVMKAFEMTNRTCVVQPTGTGKSYLMSAISEGYKRVLVSLRCLSQKRLYKKSLSIFSSESPPTSVPLSMTPVHASSASSWAFCPSLR